MESANARIRVVLLNPPTACPSTEILLGLAYLAASLRQQGHEVKLVDTTAPYKRLNADETLGIIREFRPHFIGVTLTITYIPQTYDFLSGLRKLEIPIVAGGPHCSCLPEEVLAHGVDIASIGEGEITITELAQYFAGERKIESIDGICFKNSSSQTCFTARRQLLKDIDNIPFPNFSDFPIRNYTGSDDVDSNPLFWSILTSRGCPFDCTFCAVSNVFGRGVRFRSAGNIFTEIRQLVERFGVKKITFQDDEILSSKQRFLELCELIASSPLKLQMSMRTRIDSIDREVLLKAKSIGLTRVAFGIESFNDDTLKRIRKRYTLEKIHQKFRIIAETKFPFVSFNNLCGFPWESEEYFRGHIREISKIPKSVEYFTTAGTPMPFPKTELYEQYHKEYGFTNWWLDPKKHTSYFFLKKKPFFIHFLSMFVPLFIPDRYWNYSRRKKRAIEWFTWKLAGLFLRKHFFWFEYAMVMPLCRLSHALWRINPEFEEKLFLFFPREKLLRLKDKIIFTNKY